MKKRMLCSILLIVISFVFVTGCTIFKEKEVANIADEELTPASSIVMDEQEAMKINNQIPIHLYFTDKETKKLVKEIRYIPLEDAKKNINALASELVREIAKGPEDSEKLEKTIYTEDCLRGPIKVDERIATVDMNKSFVDSHPGGKEKEEQTIYSIVNSLTELKEIEKVQFLVEGKKVEEFKGDFKFDIPFPRNETIISSKAASLNNDNQVNSNDQLPNDNQVNIDDQSANDNQVNIDDQSANDNQVNIDDQLAKDKQLSQDNQLNEELLLDPLE